MDVLEAIKTRRSVREYAPTPIPPEVMQRMHDAIRAAPSACNLQPWHFVFVTEHSLRRRIAKTAKDRLWIADAPVIVVACGLPERAYQCMGGHGNSVEIDVAIALDHLTLAAVAEGLGTCWIGAFDERALRRQLLTSGEARVVAIMTLGYPKSPAANRPLTESERKPAHEIFSEDQYSGPYW